MKGFSLTMEGTELLQHLQYLASSDDQKELLQALEKSALRYSTARFTHVRAITEGDDRETIQARDHDRRRAHDALISHFNAFVRSLPDQKDKKFFSPWLGDRYAIGYFGMELALQIAKCY